MQLLGRFAFLAAIIFATVTTTLGCKGFRLLAGQELNSGECIQYLRNKEYALYMQGDGNLVFRKGGEALWASNTADAPGAIAAMQGDGNFVIYHGGRAIFASSTAGAKDAYLTFGEFTDGRYRIFLHNTRWAKPNLMTNSTINTTKDILNW